MKVSIIIPCYKAEKYISDIINDVLSQTFTDYELIIVSNGEGREAQEDVIHSFVDRFPNRNIQLLSTEVGGVSKARNLGIDSAQGDYIAFLDADDRIGVEYLKILTDAISTPLTEIVVGGYIQHYTADNKTYEWNVEDISSSIEDCIFKLGWIRMAPPYAKLYLRSFLLESKVRFSEDFSYNEDGIFNFQLILSGVRNIQFVKQTGYQYICRDKDSAVNRFHYNFKESWEIRAQLLSELYGKNHTKEQTDELKAEFTYEIVFHSLQNLFKPGNPFTFKEKVNEVKNLLWDDEAVRLVLLNHPYKGKSYYKLFNKLYSTNSPFLLTFAYSLLHILRHRFDFIYYKLRGKLWK